MREEGSRMKKPPRRATANEAGLRHDIAELSSMKFLLERLFGRPVWYRLKETGSIRTWRHETIRLLRAIDVSIASTVHVADEEWREDVRTIIAIGIREIKAAEHIDTLLSDLAATLSELVFTQIGIFPIRNSDKVIPVIPRRWTLDGLRSVQYVQTPAQRAASSRRQKRLAENARRAAEGEKR
jgi:hypothetical protein